MRFIRYVLSAALGFAAAGFAFAGPELPGWTIASDTAQGVTYMRKNSPEEIGFMRLGQFDDGHSTYVIHSTAKSALVDSGLCPAMEQASSDSAAGGYRSSAKDCALLTGRDANSEAFAVYVLSASNAQARADAQALFTSIATGKPVSPRAVMVIEPSQSPPVKAVIAPADDTALKTAIAAIPKSNIPQFVSVYGQGSYSGWPPSYVYHVTTHLYFANGYMTRCSDWDPGVLSPTPDSLGRAYPDCGLVKWRRKGAAIEVQDENGAWNEESLSSDDIIKFKPGQRLDVAFGNVGAIGFSGPGMVSVGTISGGDLRLAPSGDIAAGSWSTTVISGSGIGGGSARETGPVIGRYYLDGHIIATRSDDGKLRRGFIAGVNDDAKLGHIYLNGEHFWQRDE